MPQKIIFFAFVAMTQLFWAQGNPVMAEDYGYTARGIFTMLPATIFENTPEGLTENDKQELLATGRCDFWELAAETPDVLVFASLPFRERAVALRIFRNNVDGSVEAAIGTLEEPICSVELWRLDTAGRLVPIPTPEEPDAREFFRKGRMVPKNLNPSILICLGEGGLVARPLFWDRHGRLSPKLDNSISYQWNGSGFEKFTRSLDKHRKGE